MDNQGLVSHCPIKQVPSRMCEVTCLFKQVTSLIGEGACLFKQRESLTCERSCPSGQSNAQTAKVHENQPPHKGGGLRLPPQRGGALHPYPPWIPLYVGWVGSKYSLCIKYMLLQVRYILIGKWIPYFLYFSPICFSYS